MLGLDTETTGLHLMSGCTTFAIGIYNGDNAKRYLADHAGIDPLTRKRRRDFSPTIVSCIENAMLSSDRELVVMHNAGFDLKALCEAGILPWEAPSEESFWTHILDTLMLAHLHNSSDFLGLDQLTRKYLERGYESEKKLCTIVNKCRAYARKHHPDWIIADERNDQHPTLRSSASSLDGTRMDYWLPAAVYRLVPEALRPKLPNTLIGGVCENYLKDDCRNTWDLAAMFLAELQERHGDDLATLLSVNKQVEHVVWKMETLGVRVRTMELTAAIDACNHYISILSENCKRLSGLEVITDDKLRVLFFDTWGVDVVKKTKKGKASVDAATLLRLHDEAEPESKEFQFLGQYLSLKKYQKKLQFLVGYRDGMVGTHINPSFKICGTKTTRFSAEKPNLQQVTKASNPYEEDHPDIAKWLKASPSMRSCFGPSDGYWWLDCDYSQLQLRIFAAVTEEQEMIDAFDRGWDAHDFVARKIFNVPDNESPSKGQRRIAKNVNFGFIFGASPKKIETTAGIPGLWDTVCELFPNAHAFIEATKDQIRETGIVKTRGDYPLALQQTFSQWSGSFEFKAHAGVNYIVQGTEGVIVKRAMKYCHDYFLSEFPQGRIALQCHDELVFEMPARFPKKHVWALTELMEKAGADYGVKAPVDPELCFARWDKSVKIRRP